MGRNRVWARIVAPNRTDTWDVNAYTSLSCDEGVQGEGVGQVTFNPDFNDFPADEIIGSDGADWGLQVFQGDTGEGAKIWDGTMTGHNEEFTRNSVVISANFESLVRHLARRRLALIDNNTTYTISGSDPSTGISYLGSDAFTGIPKTMSPAYPVVAGRSDFHLWTGAIGAIDSSISIFMGMEANPNLWDSWYEICEVANLAILLNEAPETFFTYNFEYPYARNDYTGDDGFLVSDDTGLISSLRRGVDLEPIQNVLLAMGQDKTTNQKYGWAKVDDSIERYGIYENGAQRPAVGSSLVAAGVAETMLNARGAYPTLTWEMDLIRNEEVVFNLDYGRRDVIRVYHSALNRLIGKTLDPPPGWPGPGETINTSVIGWSMNAVQGEAQYTIRIGDRPRNFIAEIQNNIGSPDGRSMGGVYVRRAGI